MHAEKRQDSSGSPSAVPGILNFGASLKRFRADHDQWLEGWESAAQAVYRLPNQSIEILRGPVATQRALLSEQESVRESAFTGLCNEFKSIGCWMGQPVTSTWLVRPDPLPSDESLRSPPLNWTRSQIGQAHQLVKRAEDSVLRLIGYMGWLVTDPVFIECRDELAERWMALDAKHRPFPIQRAITVGERPEGTEIVAGPVAQYQRDLEAFLDRWGLMRMVTWDIPEPQGPLLPALLSADAQAMPQHGLHIVLPVHYPLTATDDLLRQIQEQQAQLAVQAKVDPSMAGLRHYKVYAQMFDVFLLEMIIRSRCERPSGNRGLVTTMEFVIAKTLDMSVGQVQKHRKAISACKRGQRSTVKWLNSESF